MSLQPYPKADYTRVDRLIQDLADILHAPAADTDFRRRAGRWLGLVCQDAVIDRRWWFLDNAASKDLTAGQDVIDLKGHIDRVAAVFAPRELTRISLDRVTALRAAAQHDNTVNAGEPHAYALEAGRRVHLWPAPAGDTAFACVYTRPVHPAIVPATWEPILINGAIGLYGRHYDRDALSQDPQFFESRYRRGLKRARLEDFDVHVARTWEDQARYAIANATANSDTDTAVENVVPASLTGIDYVTIELGNYPLTVNQDS